MKKLKEEKPVPTFEKKIWGGIEELFKDASCRLVRAHAVAKGYCSTHRHEHMDNVFILTKGKLKIVSLPGSDASRESLILDKHRQCMVAKAGVKHLFECLEDAEFYELYIGQWNIPPDADDIIRDDVGGIRQ